MSLDDLRVTTHEDDGMWGITETTRPATRSDLEAVIRSEGGVERETFRGNIYVRDLEPGRYLIVPLDTGDTE
jgi:hypothetical protein